MHFPTVYARSLVVLVVILCGAVLHAPPVFGQAEGTLIVNTQPANAKVRLLYVKPKFAQGVKLPPGKYMIDVQAEGYETVFREFHIEAGKTSTVDVTLKPVPGATPKPAESKPAETKPEEAKPEKLPADAKADSPGNATAAAPKDAEPTGQLFVETQPDGAIIRILSIKPKFKQGIALEPGTYRVSITKEGYSPQELAAEIKPREKTTLKVQLEREKAKPKELPLDRKGYGRLYVDATPGDATIRVLRIKPVFEQGIELKVDKYTVDIQKDGYEKQVLRVDVKDREATHLSVTLTAEGTGGESAAATPADAAPEDKPGNAAPDGGKPAAPAPNAPATSEQPPAVTPPAEAKVVSTTNQTGAKDAIATGHGKLLLNMTPPDAEATITELETRYQHGMALPVGNYTISFIKEGFEDHAVRATIEDGKALTLDVTLKPESTPVASSFSKLKEVDASDLKSNTGKLFLEVSPSDATIMVLNIKPKFEQGIELKAGSYRLDIRRDGYAPMRVVVSIASRKAATYRVVLQPATQASTEQSATRPQTEAAPSPVSPQQAEQAKALLQESRTLLQEGREDKALEQLGKTIGIDPSLVEAFLLRAAALARQNKQEQALEDYSRAIKLANKDPRIFLERARLNEALARTEAACYDYWMACSLDACEGIRDAQKKGLCQ